MNPSPLLTPLTILCLFLSWSPSVHGKVGIKCVRCEALECATTDELPEQCPENVTACVTFLQENLVDRPLYQRYEVTRDCFTEQWKKKCDAYALANMTCHYCDDRDGCNLDVEAQEPLICRRCNHQFDEEGLSCDTVALCLPMASTVPPLCYAALTETRLGFQYGCFHRMHFGMRWAMAKQNYGKYGVLLCDSNHCNAGMDKLFANHTHVLDKERYCYLGKWGLNPGLGFCGANGRKFVKFCAIDKNKNVKYCLDE